MRKGIVQLVAIGVVIGVATTLVAVLFQWLPTSASEEFDRIQDIYWFATWMSVVIFAIVAAVVVFSVWKWRVPPDDDAEGPPIHGHTGLEIAWTAIPVVILVVIVGAFYIKAANYQPFIPEPETKHGGSGLDQSVLSMLTGAGSSHYGWYGVLAGASIVFFAFIGFDIVATMAEETKEPQRNVPRGILASLGRCRSARPTTPPPHVL